jgi:phage recombination protein Bet
MSTNEMTVFKTDHGDVELSPQTVRNYLVPADSKVTDQEIKLFIELCKYQMLNPFIREVYLVKYGNYPTSMVTGKEVFTKRAQADERFQGIQAGITLQLENGQLERREGSLLLVTDRLVGGWCKVYIKGYAVPMFDEVSFTEYMGVTAEGKPTKMWATKPATMIRKVAIVHALREAFPDKFQGLYSQEEINTIDSSTLPEAPVDITDKPKAAKKKTETQPDWVADAKKAMTVPAERQDDTSLPADIEQRFFPPEETLNDQLPPVLGGSQPVETPVKDVFDTPSIQDVKDVVFPFGIHKGKTLAQINQTSRQYLEWFAREGKSADLVPKVNQFLLNYPAPTATSKTTTNQAPAPWQDGYNGATR